VVKGSILPAFGRVALSAILTETPAMGIILGMAGEAVCGGIFKVGGCARLCMASHTISGSVFTLQGEGLEIVVKGFAVGVDAIMTSQALVAKRSQMSCHVRRVNLLVAGGAARQIHCRNSVAVAICAGEAGSAGGDFMPFQGIAGRFMGKALQVHNCQGSLRAVVLGVTILAAPGLALRQHDRVKIVWAGQQVLVAN